PLMAGVFIKRLKKGIALESCATVQYLFEKPKKRLFEKDLLTPSDYNTYLHKGYPPGPISNPGMPALLAAFNPEETDNLFFLLKPDGYHYFSKDHKEHAQAKKKYIDVLYE
ncbi:MAG TPA: endolytic transglycosylase MltG, partial [Leptospiraceae bacterium]|nr:endolytic transglycosylase MltG [Leptospiraceae bacterium]